MNERIKQLMDKAMVKTADMSRQNRKEIDPEKFAELIIRECMMLVEGFEMTQEVALDEYVDYEASDVLKKHFEL